MRIEELVRQTQFRSLRYGFYKLVYIRPTQLCPANCRHCSARAGPGAGRTADLDDLREWVPSIVSLPGIEWIGIEGGEVFAVMPQLKVILQTAQEYGIYTSVVTNAYWATDERQAREVLGRVPRINFLVISADQFHEEFIPLERVITALKVGLEFADRVAVQICIGDEDPPYTSRLFDQAGSELFDCIYVIETQLQYIGRARETGIMDRPECDGELPDFPCIFLGTPVLREDGQFVACCQQDSVLSSPPNFYHLGNLKESSPLDLKAFVDEDVYFQTLRVFGPKAIARAALKFGWGWTPRTYQRDNICDLCSHLTSNRQVVEGFRRRFNTAEYKRKLMLGRSVLYSEPFVV
jgi:hypothetical protein